MGKSPRKAILPSSLLSKDVFYWTRTANNLLFSLKFIPLFCMKFEMKFKFKNSVSLELRALSTKGSSHSGLLVPRAAWPPLVSSSGRSRLHSESSWPKGVWVPAAGGARAAAQAAPAPSGASANPDGEHLQKFVFYQQFSCHYSLKTAAQERLAQRSHYMKYYK